MNTRLLSAAAFALAIAGLGIETLLCAHVSSGRAGFGYRTVPVIPWPPALPWLAYLLGLLWPACASGMLFTRTARISAMLFAAAFVACALLFVVPQYVAHPLSISLRTRVFEPLAIASLAWARYEPAARYVLALCLAVFGVDHFLALTAISGLVPAWIPWHILWVALFGAAMITAGIAFAAGVLQQWAGIGMAVMFSTWLVTLHVPRTLGFYGVPRAMQDPNEWSSMLIAFALAAGFWSMASAVRLRAAAPLRVRAE